MHYGGKRYSVEKVRVCDAIVWATTAVFPGPDLSAVGLRRGASCLYRSITAPGAEVPDNFNVYRKVISVPDNYLFVLIETATGEKYSGIRMNEDTFSIQLRDTRDRLMSFRKSDLSKIVKRWGFSPMPSYAGVSALMKSLTWSRI